MDATTATIFATIIVEAASIIGILIKNSSERKETAVEQAKRDQKIEDRLERLEKKVDEHNGYAEKFSSTEKTLVRLEAKFDAKFGK